MTTAEAIRDYLSGRQGNIMLATGSKELAVYAPLGGGRLYPRVLPCHEGIAACERAGIPHRNIIAMQGPFSIDLNLALIRQHNIKYLVTKDGGRAGGFDEKARAARLGGAELIILRPPEDEGQDYDEILRYFRHLCMEDVERG